MLSQPSLIELEAPNIHETTYIPVMKYDVDIKKNLYGNIVEFTMFPGIVIRMSREVASLDPDNVKDRVVALPKRKYSVSIGGFDGSILIYLNTFQQIWIAKTDSPTN